MSSRRRPAGGEHENGERVDRRSTGGEGGDQRFRRDQAFAALPKSGARSPLWL